MAAVVNLFACSDEFNYESEANELLANKGSFEQGQCQWGSLPPSLLPLTAFPMPSQYLPFHCLFVVTADGLRRRNLERRLGSNSAVVGDSIAEWSFKFRSVVPC